MISDKVLEQLMSYKNEKDYIKREVIINGLINELKAEIYSASLKKSVSKTTLQRNKKALSLLKKWGKKRDCFGYCDYQTIKYANYQVMTDGFTLFMLKEPLELPKIPDNLKFPTLDSIGAHLLETIDAAWKIRKLDLDDILAKLKAKAIEKRDGIYGYRLDEKWGVDAQSVKNIVDILGTNDLKAVINDRDVAFFINERTGDVAIQMPMRMVENG